MNMPALLNPAAPRSLPETVSLLTANVLNLALPERIFYDADQVYSTAFYQHKVNWLAQQMALLRADVVAVQEVWDEQALRDVVSRSGLAQYQVHVPGAENDQGRPGAQGTPCVGLVSRLPLRALRRVEAFPPGCAAELPELGLQSRFSRAPLLGLFETPRGQPFYVLTAHLKSQRPKFLQDASGQLLEDAQDPRVRTRARMRSLCLRAVEAAALRTLVIDLLQHTPVPLVLMGDLNDSLHSVTTQIITDQRELLHDRAARDTALFNAADIQTGSALKRDVAYSHVFQGHPEVLDHVLVSEEFRRDSKFSVGEVLRVDYFNDHLKLERDRSFSDHGFVRALLQFGRLGGSDRHGPQ